MHVETKDAETIFTLLRKLYRSYGGTNLSGDDWLNLTKTIEELNGRYDNQIIRALPEETLPILIQPLKALTFPDGVPQIDQFDFVFQMIKAPYIKSIGEVRSALINETLRPHGLQLGIDLSDYEYYLNNFRAEVNLAALHGRVYPEFRAYDLDNDRWYIFSFDPKNEVKATFANQIWTTEFMGIKAAGQTLSQLKDHLKDQLFVLWRTNPDALKKPPIEWIEYERHRIDGRFSDAYPVWSNPCERPRPAYLESEYTRFHPRAYAPIRPEDLRKDM